MSTRIESLDFLRGSAILGMLIANLPWHTGTSMSRIQEVDASSVAAWLLQYAIIDQRFMPVFCMLFGAGLLILAEGRRDAPGFKGFFLKRMGILFLIGLAHAYLIWPGDILLTYAICGPILLLFLRAGPVTLLAAGIALKVIHISILQWPDLYYQTLDRLLFAWWLEIGDPPMSEAEAYAGTYADLLAYNTWRNQFIQITAMLHWRIWNALGFMLIGMAFYRWGVLQGAASARMYKRMLIVGLAVGLPFLIYGLLARIGASDTVGPFLGWQVDWPLRGLAHNIGTAFTAIALLSLLVTGFHAAQGAAWLRPIQAVGRMALTNYVMHSVIFIVVFAGFEWVAYDTLDPDDRLVWVIAIWALQLSFSPLWLEAFNQGPLEMAWRRLAGSGPARMSKPTPQT
ncbi:MAG: DUF418 domain-containing protein [Alphaproteobacteria bacterium]|nr:DUF418 domain-containing protein [Alphaproteobacteria bacterium]